MPTPVEAAAIGASPATPDDLESIFRAQYERIARIIGRVIRDPARAEELAVEVFLRWPQHSDSVDNLEGWLYRTAVRIGLDELRRQSRRRRYEGMLGLLRRREPTPEEIHQTNQEQDRVRAVLLSIGRRQAGMLLLRSQGLSYAELASALQLNSSSIGTLVSRAQQSFKKEYVKRYGTAE
jgi:RNA polymerase sigma-70 factor, ECF subfamily